MDTPEKIQRAFFTLVRSGLWNREVDDTTCFPLSAAEWKEVWNQAVRQSVRGTLYQGISLLPEEWLPAEDLMMLWMVDIERIERRNRHMNQALAELMQYMQRLDIHPLVLKGQGVAQFYVHPLSRECGDIDLYFPNPAEERRAIEWVRKQGAKVVTEADGTHAYRFKGIEIEHHVKALDLFAPRIQPYLKEQMLQRAVAQAIEGEENLTIPVLAPLVDLLSLNAHILKHSMGHGIGLRQFCDLARAYHSLYSKVDGEALRACYQRCGILSWSQLLHSFLVRQLGLSKTELPYREEWFPPCEMLLERVLNDGNFGKYAEERMVNNPSVWKRKLNTALSFVRHFRFSLKYAPHEALALWGKLVLGNIKS